MNEKADKRIHQIHWIFSKWQEKESHWYYYDLLAKRQVYLDGSPKIKKK